MASYFNGGLGDLDGFFLNDKGAGGCLVYNTGTASQSTTTITGSGTTFTLAMVGGIVVWADNTRSFITGYTSGLSLSALPSQTIGSQSFVIYYGSIQATSGYIGMKGANISGIGTNGVAEIDSQGNVVAVGLDTGKIIIGTSLTTAPVAANLTPGTAIGRSNGSGSVTINNTGVTSVAGTTNQVSTSAGTGAITLSIPSTFVAPGTISDTTGMMYSTTTGIAAAGSSQSGATALTTSYNVVTSGGAGTGVVLPTGIKGLICVVANRGTNVLSVYPALGSAIDGAVTNVAVSVPIGATAVYEASSSVQWYTTAFPISGGTSTTVTYGNGTVSVNNTGATSLSGTANQVAVSASTGAITLSTPSVFIAPGTISDTTGMKYSTTDSISAAGTTQGGATALTTSYNVVTTVAANSGVVLPTATAGLICVVVNRGANALSVYPAGSAAIDGAGASTAVLVGVGSSATYEAVSVGQWYTVGVPVVAGTATSVTYGNGSVAVNNTGATSLAGTANQVAVSASTGAITLSTPSTFVAPGTISDTTGMKYSTTNSIAAAGTTQGTATALTTSYNAVLTVGSGTGVVLPTATSGLRCVVVNRGLNTLSVYPASGAAIDGAATNAAVSIGVGASATYEAANTTQWYTVDVPVVAGTATSVTYNNGSVSVNNTGATSLAGTANQVAVSASTGAITLSTPATFIGPGTIQDTTGMKYSTTNSISAAGSTQGTGTALTTSYNVVTTVAASAGVVLPTATAGLICVVVNRGANALSVYPASGAAIDGASTNAAVLVGVNATSVYEAATSTQWYTTAFPISAGTSTTVTYGNGTVSINNTGATSLAGTANQVAVSASTGAITLSTPSTFVAPGTIQDTTGMKYSTSATVAAAGTTQGGATALTTSYNVVTSSGASALGVVLPTATAGLIVVVVNKATNTLNVYPAGSAAIDGAGASTAVSLVVGATVTYEAASGTQWYTVDPVITAGGAVSVTYGNGITTIANTGATSIAGTANEITASASTGAITLSTPATFIGPGTIQDTTGMKYSTTGSISAAGSTQGTGTALTTSYNVVTTVAASAGVVLPTATAGLICVVVNRGANALSVYPASGAAIDGASTNAAVLVGVNATSVYEAATSTQWYTTAFPISAGTSTTVTYGNGTVSINNTGATSITGTTNEITASASTGAITLSTPATFVGPGTIQDTTGMKYSTTAAISAAGTTQGGATALTTSYNVVTTAAVNSGVVLMTATAGLRVVVVNQGANTLKVYPAGSAAIDGAGASTAVLIGVGSSATYEAVSATQWYTVDVPVVAGTATTVTYGNGSVSVNNTGATSIAGTANEITASASTGAITLSTPATFVGPGTIQDTTGMKYSTTAAISAAGTTQGGATALTTSYNVVTTAAVNSGVVLMTATAGLRVVVVNQGANTLKVYPASGAAIDGAGANTAVLIGVGSSATYEAVSATQWYTVDVPVVAGTATTVTYGNGNVSVNNTGATSIAGTANEITASASTGAITLSTPSTFIAPGSIQDTTGMKYSATNSIAAAGTTQATATVLTTSYNVVTSSSGGSTGVALPTGTSGLIVTVVNRGGVSINVYPANGSGASIDGAASNAAVVIGVDSIATYQAISSGQWYTVGVPVVAGTATTVTYGNGSVAVNNTGATSIAGTANQVAASASTGAITLSLPSPLVTPGELFVNTAISGSLQSPTSLNIVDTTASAGSEIYRTDINDYPQIHNFVNTATYMGTILGAYFDGTNYRYGNSSVSPWRIILDGTTLFFQYAGTGTAGAITSSFQNVFAINTNGTISTANLPVQGMMYIGASNVLAATAAATNGQLLIGDTGSSPVLGTITGTANEITSTVGAGSITLSIPTTFIAPGTIQDTTGMKYSTTTAVSAAGTTQGGATALTTSYNVVTTVALNAGVVLPTASAGLTVVVVNQGANTLNVYPASGAQIDAAGTNVAVTLVVAASTTYQASSSTQWYTVQPETVAGTNIVATQGNGQVSIATSATPSFTSETLTATSSQLVLGTTNTTTLSATAPAASVVYTLGDAGGAANIPLATNSATVGYVLTATGANSIATWQDPAASGKVLYLGTGNSGGPSVFIPPASTSQLYLTLVGGGGAGGGVNAANAGGGGAGHAINKLPIAMPVNTNPSVINIGSGGIGALSTGTATVPGNSTFLFNTTIYNNGTAAATVSTTVTGTTTVWNAAMVGGALVSGGTTVIISGWTSVTSITVASAVTISGSYNIYYNGCTMSSSGTVAQTTTAITGTGSTFNSSMPGGIIVYSTGVMANITVYGSATTMTAVQSQTVAGGTTYNVYYGTPQLYTTGTVGTGGGSSTTVTGSGTAFTSAMIGGSIIVGGHMTNVVNVVSGTSLTVSPAVTVTNGTSYTLYYSLTQTISYTAYGGGNGGTNGGGGGGAGGADTTGSGGPASTNWPQLGPAGGAGSTGAGTGSPGSVGGFSVSGGGGGGAAGMGANSPGGIGGQSTASLGGGGAAGFRGNGGNSIPNINDISTTTTILLGTGAGSSGANPGTFTALTGSETNIFVSNFDYIYIGVNLPWSTFLYSDSTNANTSITPLFQYSLAGTTWQTISGSGNVSDGTSGFTVHPDIVAIRGPPYVTATNPWSLQHIAGTNAYWLRIQRTTVTVTTVPKATTSTILVQSAIQGGFSASPNTGAGGAGGTSFNDETTTPASGGDGGSGFCELWYE